MRESLKMILLFQRTCQQKIEHHWKWYYSSKELINQLGCWCLHWWLGVWYRELPQVNFLKKNMSTSWELGAEPYKLDPNISIRGRRSIVSDLDWVCEESWIPAFSQVRFCVSESPRTSFFSPSSLSAQCLACSSLAGSGEKFEKKL